MNVMNSINNSVCLWYHFFLSIWKIRKSLFFHFNVFNLSHVHVLNRLNVHFVELQVIYYLSETDICCDCLS